MTVASLSEKRRLLREQLLRKEGLAAEGPRRISRRAQPGPAPLSFGQRRLWFLHQLDPGSTGYNISEVVGLEGRLDPGALGRALAEVVRRHEVLRTAFPQGPGEEPAPTVAPAAQPALLADLAGLPPGLRTAAAARAAAQLAAAPFDLERGPVLRATLLRLGGDHAPGYVLALALHHIATDGWSMGLLLRELITLYEAFAAGEPSPLPELPLQYADFAAWQREHLSGPALERHLSYWKERLAGAPTLLKLPTDRPWPAVQSFRGGRTPVGLGGAAMAALRDLARREGATPFMVVLAALGVLLHRYSRQDEVLVGAPTANRGRPELEGLIGFFVNTLALRVDLRGGPRFTGLVGRVRETVLGAEAHQDLPFEQLVDALDLPRDLSRTPLFQVLLAYQNLPSVAERPSSLAIGRFGLDASVAQFELSFFLSDDDNGLGGGLIYRSGLFDAPTAQRLARHFEALLEGAVLQPGAPVPELPLLAPAERHQLLTEWNDTAAAQPPRLLLHALFEDQAARTPDATAVACEDERLSYGELNRRASRLAGHLRRLGVGPEARVAVCAERSPEVVVGLLAVLKAGGAYVPVDPEYPRDRVAYMLEDAGVRVLLTQRRLAGDLPAHRRVVELDGDWGPGEEAEVYGGGAEPENLAYVIYTSGSTGRPKGVQIQHRSLAGFVVDMARRLGIGAADRLLSVTSLSFDIFGLELFVPLTCGAQVRLASREATRDGALLARTLEESGATVLQSTPATWRMLLEAGWSGRRGLKLLCGGEAMTGELAARLLALPEEGLGLRNLFGPTETTIWSAVHRVESAREPMPIGRPIGNTELYVLDEHRQPVPVGGEGELYIGGAGQARGYLHRGDLTAERFVPNPFAGVGARLYRTGDLARSLPDGKLEFLGRIDHQVKVRGFRIELGEIESVLAALPGVREAVVLAREDRSETGPGDRRLVAYVVGEPAADALRQALRERLPEYMVPAAFVLLAALPLTPNGKVDRKALPAPEWQSAAESHVAPRTPVEEVLAGIWAELLGLERVGAADHFFALGGHSLLATRVMSRLRGAFGVEMPLRDLFEAPVLADLAARVEAARLQKDRAGAGRLTPPLVPVPREGPLPLSFAQQRLWFIDQLEPGTPLYNMPVALRVEGPLDARVLALCLGEIVRRHEALRTVFPALEGSPVQVIRPAALFRLPVVDLSGLPERRREALTLGLVDDEARRPFDLARGPLLRGALLKLAAEDHVAALTLHHIISDGWSMGILVREITTLYAAFTESRPSPLPELPVQYADFAAWQHSWLHGEVLEGEIAFWRRQLAGLPPLLELPTDRPRPAVQSFRGASRPVRLPAELARQVQALSRREEATLFMVLLAGFQALLARHSGQDDLAVGTPVAGRNRVEVEGLIGFFVNTLVLRGDSSGGPSFRELLGRARETALAAHTHQDVPFERLVQELAPERSLAQTPLFQVLLVLQNAPVESLEIQDLRLRPVGGAGATAPFDLTLTFREQDGGLHGTAEHATDLFDATTIDRLTGHFERLLAAATAAPDLSVSALPLLSAAERHQLLAEWGGTEAAPPEVFVHHLFEEQARRDPAADAVLWRGQRLTYGELDQRANRLAWRLRAAGVGPESRVAICAERSPDQVLAVLAVLKVGGAYLPLDPSAPRERLLFILRDAQVSVLLAHAPLLSGLPVPVPVLELGAAAPDDSAIAPPPCALAPENLAYIIYTSGSTGEPKGVLSTHGGLANTCLAWQERFGGGTRRHLQTARSSFDVFTGDVVRALCQGACLVLCPEETLLSSAGLHDLMLREEIDHFDLVPAVLAALLDHLEATGAAFPPVRRAVVGADACRVADWERLRRLCGPRTRVLNLYGVSESSVDSTAFEGPVERMSAGANVPLGAPLAGSRVSVLDPSLHPVPVGVAGELYLGGAGLARGYLGRPDLTAQRFVPDPFGGSGGRLYRTGDLVRQFTDGSLDYLGRVDHQVKVRGFRIELGEIEALLVALDGVREAVVLARADRPGSRQLVAYVAGDAAAGALRQSLRERLPDYMVPAAFVLLTALPLTPNGKVDRKALPAPEWQGDAESHAAPRTPVEEVLAGIWAELLGREQVGAADHFFELGGHSLLATRVMSRLRAVFGVEVPLRDLFEVPVLADLAARVETAVRAGAGRLTPPLVPAPREGSLPLSFAQQRLWFIDQLEPGSPLYNIPVALRTEGPLDAGVLALCLGEIVRRHEALRTVFATRDGEPVQVIRPAAPFRLPLVDLSGLPESRRGALALDLAGDEASRPFDLARGPLLRGLLLRLAPSGEQMDHVASLTMHHIVSDGWSIGILVREVTALYTAFAEGRPSPLPELQVQYADFAAWQHSWLHSEVLESEISFWRRQLEGLPPRLELPTDRPRPAVQSFRGASRPVRLPAGLTAQAQALSRREGATLFMVLLAGFQALLARYSGQDDLAVGTPVAGRNRIEIEGLIGFFVNTLVLRGDLTGEPSFRKLLGRVRETALATHMHQDVPFEKLVQELSPERSLGQTPLFQVMFVLQNVPVESLDIQDLQLRPLGGAGTTAKFDLTLALEENNSGVAGAVEHATDLFDGTTIDRLILQYERLLTATVASPELRASELPLLAGSERHQLLVEWGGAGGQPPAAPTLHGRVEAQARQAPDAPALTWGNASMSYGELNRRSNRLARWLRRQGVGPESRVGLCMQRSPDLLVGLLGILKAGGAYVPLDPGYPRERLAWMIEDAGVEVVVGAKGSVAVLPDTVRQILLDAHRELTDLQDRLPTGDLEPLADGASLAYVIYTSGSTGRPKGVLVSHGNVARLFDATQEWFGFEERDVWTLFHSYAFDFSVWEIWGALLYGGRLVIVPYDASRSPELFLDLLIRERVTVLNQTPSAFAQLAQVDEERGGCETDLRLVIFGGEALDPAGLAPWMARHGDATPRLVNMYGITETTVHVTFRPLRAADARSERRSVIGIPIPDLTLAVMDPGRQPVPIGVPGELVVGGAGLARGYLDRPELTAERFVPDPVGSHPGARLYRSGDLGRFLPSGDVEYLGRIDHQVKIRGFRIELGEIEAALLALPGVREAVVLAREDRSETVPGDRRLVAYVVGGVAADALRQSLRERVPEHMVPAAFVVLPALPLTPNGKVDRKALPAPDGQDREEKYLAPRTPVEEVLASIWAELLGLERIGAADHFFDIGGHSLLATRVMSRLRAAFGVEMPLRELFEAPTLTDLAARVEAARRAGTGRLTPPLVPVPREGTLPLSFAQQRLWFIDQLEPGTPLYNIPVALRVEGPLDSAVLALCLGEIVRRHEALRTIFAAPEGSPVQVIQPAVPFLLPIVDLSGLPESGHETATLTLAGEEAARPFDLAHGPLLRSALLRLAEGDHVVTLNMHHIVSDGWSIGILVGEVTTLYAAFAEGRPSPLPELPVQYADFAAWQHSWLHGEVLESEISFWRRQLAGLPPRLELPTDRPRPAVQSFRGSSRLVRLPAELVRQVQAIGRREGATLFMVLLAGFQALLARYSGQDDLAVGTPVAGRNREEVEGLIGFFVNTLVLRGDLTGEPSFRELLGQARETALAAHTHQDVPFERLVQELSPERSLAQTPLFQVMLSLQNAPSESLEIRDLRLRPFGGAGATEKFDLTLTLGEHDGGLSGSVGYATDLFDAVSIDRLIRHFERLLAAAVATPDLSASALPLLSETELHEIVQEALEGSRSIPEERCIHELFAEQVERTPGALAVVDEEGAWTYVELGRRVRRLALRLRAAGVGPDQPVILYAERGVGLVTGLLGILEAGGAYLAVEPDLPLARQELLARDAHVTVAVTERRLANALPDGLQQVFLDSEDLEDQASPAHGMPPTAVTPGHLAYVLYTSGSTGTPKGVMVEHRQLTAYVQGVLERLAPPSEASFATVSSFSADLGNTSVFAALLSGGCLHVVARDRLTDADAFAERMERRPVDVLKIVPSHLAALLTAERPERSLPRRLLVLGGEPLPWSLVDRVRALAPECRLFNHYGPTETTVGVLAGAVETDTVRANVSAPLGRPLGLARAWVVDRHLQLVPAGLPGELCVGGPQVTRGYLGRPDLTSERFIPDPFSDDPGERLYRTGDLVRRRPDGPVEFLGRIDSQVKIRGFRIELGEIEAALVTLPGVREAVVLAREDRLVAYVVGDIAADALRQPLRERLPDYMVPAAFVTLEALPLTPNGKVDRKALPAPEWQSAEESFLAPRTPVEEVLAGIWAELLGLDRLGAADHFFDLGGHSLLATQVMSRLRAAFGVEMPLRDLFEAPVLAGLAARVEAALRAGAGLLTPPLVPAPRKGPLPLSFAQQRLWFIDQLEPGSPLYNMPVALRVEGPLDARVLTLCLGEIARRHEALRSVFAELEGSPVQVIQPTASFGLPVVDLSGLPKSRSETVAFDLTGQEARRPFDLARGPLLRGALLRLAEEDHVAVLTMHHIVSDGWSMGILVREVGTLYAAFAEGRPSPLPELPVQYADFAAWQHSWLHGEILESEISFWRRQLAGLPPRLELPTDRPRPAVQSFRGTTCPVHLPAELTRQVKALGRREGATLFMVLLAGFQALLARYSGQDDLAVGTPVAGRNRMETEGLIGFFVNTLVLRGDLSGEPSFRELLGRARETALAAHTHQDVPFERLVQELSPERSLAHAPLFQVMFVLQNAPAENLDIRDLRLRPVDGTGTTAKFDLTLSLGEWNGGLSGGVEHATDLYDATTIDRMIGHFERLLACMAEDPELPVSASGLLTAEEALQLAAWNTTATDYPAACVHELFARQAERSPDSVAVTFGDQDLTYHELDRRSMRLACRLRSLGVGPGALVGLCADRSPEMVVAMLGILAAGGAYVPLDPSYPQERLAFMLEDTGAGVLVVQERLAGRFPSHAGLHIEILDRTENETAPAAAGRVASLSSPGDPAYVIYTSGSTGRPKGVVVPHRAIVRLVCETDYVRLGPDDRVAQVSNSSFDAATFEVWGALLNGGRLIGIEREVTLAPREMVESLRRGGVTTLFLTTALFNQIAREAPAGFATLRHLLFGGELVDPAAVRSVLRDGSPERLLHVYGPTETTTFASWHRVESVQPGQTVPIGLPLANGALHVFDGGMSLVPLGVPGELYVGGDGLAHGYHGRPELTAERFVPDPLANASGARLYRTGDLVRWRQDGSVEFLGRVDHQVKVRGFRIEPGEIEAALRQHAGVREAVVLAREDRSAGGPGDRHLVAYVVGDALAGELRQALREQLPDHMVPAAFVTLAALPLTQNGKVDRNALPPPEWQSTTENHLAPRTPVEEVLSGIWAELLGLENVGPSDHFFDLGGHSLMATRVMSRLRSAFGVEMPLRELFEAPALADLAARVEVALRAGAGSPVPPLVPVAPLRREGPLPLSFAQQRLWFIDQLTPGSPLYNIPVALRVEGPLDTRVLALCLGEIVRRHEALRTVFATPEGTPVQVIQPAVPFLLPMVDLSGLPESRRELLALDLIGAEARRPFDLARGPLLRGLLLRIAASGAQMNHVAALTMHHIVSDGWSMGILVREVTALYAAFAEGGPSPLPELPLQYADFAMWQHSWLHGEVLEGEISFWRRQLAGLPPLLALPADHPRPSVRSFRGGSRPVRLPAGLTREAQTLSRREGATLFMVLLTAFQTLLARYSGQEELAVGTPVAGRNREEIEGLIGFFVNTLVLRGDLTGEPSFRELLGRVRETTLAAHTHQDVPFERLVQELSPERSLAQTPLFQVMLALQNAPTESLEIRNLRLRPVNEAGTTAKFDLTLSLAEHNGELLGAVQHAADLFDAATIDRLIGHFERLLAAAVVTPNEPALALPLLSPAEHAQLLGEWNDTGTAGLGEGFFHLEVATQAARAPSAVAIELGAERWTYGRLVASARRLAWHLRKLGVGPDSIVGLCAGRSPLQIVGLLAVLEAGGAWLPLDPDDPAERLAFLLDDAGARILLIEEHLRERVPAAGRPVVSLGALQDDVDEEEVEALGVEVAPDHLAYVIYTSGSTGRPKGVAVRHGSLMNLARALRTTVYSGPAGALRIGVNASFSFDGSVKQIVQLAWGHTLHLLSQDVRLDPAALVDTVRRQQLDVLDCTPSQLRLLLEAGLGTGDATPALVLVGGEAVDADLVNAALARPRTSFWNVYGPTECTVDTTAAPFAPGVPSSRIGRPLPNVQTHVVAGWGGLAPLGVPGELQVGGAGLARGYLRRPDLTGERFIPDPFSGDSGARLYRTGDLVRRLPDGSIDFLGRLDHQVKVRGFRIELGEIEAAVAALTGVSQAAVIVREDKAGDRRLVAYVVGDLAAEALRASLHERLPSYMVPATFVTLAALPLSPNGKVDKKALPAPERHGRDGDAATAYRPPHDRFEILLTRIWEEVLGIERVGLDDNFFHLGGHSLLAVGLISQIERQLGQRLPLTALFQGPTIEHLARILRENSQVRDASPLIYLRRQGDAPPWYFVHPLDGQVHWYVDLARSLGENIPAFGLQAPGLQDRALVLENIPAITEAYLSAIREAQPQGPYFLAGWSSAGTIAFEMARALQAQGQPVGALVLIDAVRITEPMTESTENEVALWIKVLSELTRAEVDREAWRETLLPLDHDGRLAHVAADLTCRGLLPPGLDPAYLERMLGVYFATLKAVRSYEPEPYDGPGILVRATATAQTHAGSLGPSFGWAPLFEGGLEIHDLPGDHYSILGPGKVGALASIFINLRSGPQAF